MRIPRIENSAYVLPALIAFIAACSGEDSEKPAGDTEQWTSFMKESWTLAPSSEQKDHCVKVPITEDIYVSAIRPIAPRGTHHTFVALTDTDDGTSGCRIAVGTGTMVYASGAGSQGLHLPPGVAIKLPAGKVLNFSLHLYNPTKDQLSGTSGLEIVRVDPRDVHYESGTTLAGPLGIVIPPGRITLKHECELTAPQTAYALFPHMHQLGVHFKTTVTLGGVDKVLHDGAYDFNEQYQLPIDALQFQPGDKIKTECTYENPGPQTVTFGESSDTEMCFSVFFSYPMEKTFMCGLGNPVESAQ